MHESAKSIKDPVCGMAITGRVVAAQSVYHGQTYYFCSALCKQMFDRAPQNYLPPAENQDDA